MNWKFNSDWISYCLMIGAALLIYAGFLSFQCGCMYKVKVPIVAGAILFLVGFLRLK